MQTKPQTIAQKTFFYLRLHPLRFKFLSFKISSKYEGFESSFQELKKSNLIIWLENLLIPSIVDSTYKSKINENT